MFWFKLEKHIIFICEDSQIQPSGVLAKHNDLEWQ